jgi:uncharacterized membrane protein
MTKRKPDAQQNPAPDATFIGVAVFLGLMAGAVLGQKLFGSPAPGALVGGLVGGGLGALGDRLRR